MGRRRQSREIALQVLYQMDLNRMAPDQALELYAGQFEMPAATSSFTEVLVFGVTQNLSRIDSQIDSASQHWRLQRMPPVDRNILRIATFELLFCEDIPPKVSINEAVDLAKKYGSEESKSFVNGVLDRLYGKMGRAGQDLQEQQNQQQ